MSQSGVSDSPPVLVVGFVSFCQLSDAFVDSLKFPTAVNRSLVPCKVCDIAKTVFLVAPLYPAVTIANHVLPKVQSMCFAA